MELDLDGRAHLDSGQLITHAPDASQRLRLVTVNILHAGPENYIHTRAIRVDTC